MMIQQGGAVAPWGYRVMAVKAWLNAGPKRIIGPERIALLRGMFVGAVLRAGGDVADAQVAAGSHIMQGLAAPSRLMKERS